MQYKYNKDTLFNATNGGLTYIHHVYPQSVGFENKKKGFKIRNEKTGSARLYQDAGIWYVKDFGDSQKAQNAIDLCMQEEGIATFHEAMRFLYAFAGLAEPTAPKITAKWLQEPTDKDINYCHIDYSDTVANTKVFAQFLTPETCEEYNFKTVRSYQFVSYKKDENKEPTKERILNTVTATDEYPIFAFKEENFTKIYEPFAKKQYRFRFFGNKPERFIYGWDRLFSMVNYDLIKQLRKQISEYAEDSTSSSLKEMKAELDELLLSSVIVASGGSDGLNIASLDYNAIWFNNETEQLNYAELQELKEICKVVYNLPDIDATGVKQGVKLGLEFLDLKTIWLPEKIKETNGKDFRDWMHNYKHLGIEKTKRAFEKLLHLALEFRWWRWNKKTSSYKYNYVSLLYFLEHQGFYVYSLNHKNQQKGTSSYIFIKIDGNIVREVTAPEIKTYVQDWLKENQISLEVLNMVIGSQFLNEKSLLSLPVKEIDFSTATQKDQVFFFQNNVIKVSAEEISRCNAGEIKNFTWKNKVIKHNIKLGQNPQFAINKDASGNWDIAINEKNNMFLNYLINASRIHWRAELETPYPKDINAKQKYHDENRFNIAGPNLGADEIHEQKQHLINKIYAIGYLLHSYKDDAKPWCVYVMDNKIPDEANESHGGSGKSFGVSKILDMFKNSFYLEGRNPRLLDNQFIYDGVDEDTDTLFVDDAHPYLNFGFFFSILTGNMRINPKHGKQFEMPFTKSPKLLITTNFVPQKLDPSTLRRLLFMVYSDYYHEKTDDYLETRQITDDFGGKKMFREEFTANDYNLFFNFCLEALQFYLSCDEKINAPDENVKKRNLLQAIGADFMTWADNYFSPDNLNTFIRRKELQDDYKSFIGGSSKPQTVNRQKKSLQMYCQLKGWELNPQVHLGSDGTIKREYHDGSGKRQVVEHYYIATPGGSENSIEIPKTTDTGTNGEPGPDLPF